MTRPRRTPLPGPEQNRGAAVVLTARGPAGPRRCSRGRSRRPDRDPEPDRDLDPDRDRDPCRDRARDRDPCRDRDRARDRGSGTVLLLGVVAVALVLLAGMSVLVRAERARGGAQTAADLAALAAASRVAAVWPGDTGASPCGVAAQVAARNGARLTECSPGGDGVVRVLVARGAGVAGTAVASARAGPADARPPPTRATD